MPRSQLMKYVAVLSRAYEEELALANDMLTRLKMDPGKRTLGELLQERQWAVGEIERLSKALARGAEKLSATARPKLALPVTNDRLLRVSEVCTMVSLSRASLYQRIAAGTFPRSCRIGKRGVRWRADDVSEWIRQLGERVDS